MKVSELKICAYILAYYTECLVSVLVFLNSCVIARGLAVMFLVRVTKRKIPIILKIPFHRYISLLRHYLLLKENELFSALTQKEPSLLDRGFYLSNYTSMFRMTSAFRMI